MSQSHTFCMPWKFRCMVTTRRSPQSKVAARLPGKPISIPPKATARCCCGNSRCHHIFAEPLRRGWATGRRGENSKIPDRENVASKITVYTLGHSTRSIDEFIGLLKAHGIELVADVRTIPKSR